MNEVLQHKVSTHMAGVEGIGRDDSPVALYVEDDGERGLMCAQVTFARNPCACAHASSLLLPNA